MANIAKRPNGKWRARYRDANGKEWAKHFDRRGDAQRWLDEVTASVLTGLYVDPKAGRATLAEYSSVWQAAHIGRPATAQIVDNALRVHIGPALGSRPLASLVRSDIQGFVRGLSERLSPGTVRNVYDVLKRVLQAAVHDKLIPASPCVRISLPAMTDQEAVPPSAQQVQALCEAIDPRYRGLTVLLAGSGLRVGEALGLTIRDVDFLRRTVRVERQRLQNGLIGPTKTMKSVRTVPLGQLVVDELAAHLATFGGSEELFSNPMGRPLTYQQWKKAWALANDAVGLDFKTHDLRHFTASALISGGASVKQVQTVLGHSSAAITLKVYSHLWPGDDDRTRAVMDAALSPLADSVRTEAASGT